MCAASEVLRCDKTLDLQSWKIEDLDDMDDNDRWIAEEFAARREQMANQQPAAPNVAYTVFISWCLLLNCFIVSLNSYIPNDRK